MGEVLGKIAADRDNNYLWYHTIAQNNGSSEDAWNLWWSTYLSTVLEPSYMALIEAADAYWHAQNKPVAKASGGGGGGGGGVQAVSGGGGQGSAEPAMQPSATTVVGTRLVRIISKKWEQVAQGSGNGYIGMISSNAIPLSDVDKGVPNSEIYAGKVRVTARVLDMFSCVDITIGNDSEDGFAGGGSRYSRTMHVFASHLAVQVQAWLGLDCGGMFGDPRFLPRLEVQVFRDVQRFTGRCRAEYLLGSGRWETWGTIPCL